MSFLGAGNASDIEQDKGVSDYRLSRSNNNLAPKPTTSKFSDVLWNSNPNNDSDSEISDSGNFLAKGNKNVVIYMQCDYYAIVRCLSSVNLL